jgi:hypothetical protein
LVSRLNPQFCGRAVVWHCVCLTYVHSATKTSGSWLDVRRLGRREIRMSTARTHAAPRTHPSEASDEQLLFRYGNTGDEKAFEALVYRYEHQLYSYLARYLKDASLAEEAFQEVFLRVHKKAQSFEEGRQVRPWLYAIATHPWHVNCLVLPARQTGSDHER